MTRPHQAAALRLQGALAVLRHAHAHPGVTRAAAAAALGLSSGSATEIMSRLRAASLLSEAAAPGSGGRGRPSPALVAHPSGPLAAVVEITHTGWSVTTAELGGAPAPAPVHRHLGAPASAVLTAAASAVRALVPSSGGRIRAVGVAIPGTIHGHTLVEATNLRWHDVDLSPLGAGLPLAVGNDASLAGLAESLRGAARAAPVALHLTVEVGVGGVLLVAGAPVLGASGAGGEFGHMPLGDPGLRCPCGARGCWDLTVDGRALARALGEPEPPDPRAYAATVLSAAAASGPRRPGGDAARRAVETVAAALGRGIGALVNATDPAVVTLGGLGADLLAAAPDALHTAITEAAMAWRRTALPPVVAAELGSAGPAIGAAEAAMAEILTERVLGPDLA